MRATGLSGYIAADTLSFFMQAVIEESRGTILRVQHLLDLQSAYRTRLQRPRGSALPTMLADRLFETPYITIPHAAQELGVTYRAALKNVEKLVDAGILVEMPTENRPRFFVAPEVFNIVDS